jgi:transposase
MPDSGTVLPAPNLLDLIGIRADANVIILFARTSASTARCPACGKRSGRVHSRYTRTLADLPWQGVPVTVGLHARRFFCDEGNCDRIIFAERLSGVAARYGRRTERLDGWLLYVSFALGGEAGSRLLKDLGVVVSGDMLLNHIRSMRPPNRETPRVLSVDDFAFRRGTRYGAVLVDLERHMPVDVLPDRSANTFARWLTEHPGVEVVSRNRSGEYGEAVSRVAPRAVQVTDRFHLLKNLRDVVSRVFRQHDKVLDLVPRSMNHLQRLTNLRLDREASKRRTREQTQEPFESYARPFEERHEEHPDRPNPRDTSPHKDAVVASMVLPYSQGETEGRVNKLKLVKRSMYGRGKFDLLRRRVLYTTS